MYRFLLQINREMYRVFEWLQTVTKHREMNRQSNDTTFSFLGARCSSVVRAFAHGAMGRRIDPSWVDPFAYFSFHDWCNKCRGMYYPVCGMMHIKKPLLLMGKSSPCGGSGFPLSLSEWSFTICVTPYNRK